QGEGDAGVQGPRLPGLRGGEPPGPPAEGGGGPGRALTLGIPSGPIRGGCYPVLGCSDMGASPYRFKDDPHSSHSVILARLGDGRGRKALDVGGAGGSPPWALTPPALGDPRPSRRRARTQGARRRRG